MPKKNIIALFSLTVLNMQDGFDILAISFAANSIVEDWNLAPSKLGLVFSSSLFGMLIGAALISPQADRFGRKQLAVVGLTISGIGMLLAGFAYDVNGLIFGRFITGVGIGAIFATLNTLVAEYAGPKLRSTMISIFHLGFPIGAILTGYICLWLLGIGTWRTIFFFGAALSFIFIPIVLLLPKSEEFSTHSKDHNTILTLARYKILFSSHFRRSTILISCIFFLQLFILYFILSWVPKLVVDMGFTDTDGNRVGRLINLVGMFGIISIGLLSLRHKVIKLTTYYFLGLCGMLLVIANVPSSLLAITTVVALTGFFTHGAQVGLYSTLPEIYPPEIRVTGSGFAIGVSRFGAVLGPLVAGYLIQYGIWPQDLFLVFILPALIAAIGMITLARTAR